MNNINTRNRLFTLLLLVIALLIPQWGWAQTANRPKKGDGSADNPYIIRTAENLAWFRNEVNKDFDHGNICAKIADDVEVIDMSTVCYKANASKKGLDWVPIGDGYTGFYQGTFDGNGKTITNLYIDTYSNCVGLFGFTYGATIKNLTLEYATVINDGDYTGILVGCAENESTLQNIKISKTCQIEMYSYNMTEGVINYTGGIAGKLVGNAYNCLNYANIQGKKLHEIRDVGGLFGEYKGNSMTACANYGKVTVAGSYVGGLVGSFLSGTIQDCANYGDVECTYNVGGMAGYVYDGGKIQNVFCYGSISGTEGPSLEGIVFGNTPNKGPGTEGMVAYYSGAKLTIRGNEQKVKAFGGDNFSEDKATGYTAAQLKSGEVAFKLQQNASSKAKWGQNLANGGDIYPVIGSKYQVYPDNVTLKCKTKEVVKYSSTYNNTSSAIRYQHGQIVHHAATATCTKAGTKEYWQCQDCQKTFSDEQLTKELTDVTQPALGHINNADGYCSRCQPYGVKPSLENGVYQIAKPCHLAWFRYYVNGTIVNDGEAAETAHPTASAKLTANIDLKGYCYKADKTQSLNELSWVPIGNETNKYKGTFDGNGKTISNLYINASQRYMGLFGYTYTSTIKNLTLEYANVTNAGYYTGFLVGFAGYRSILQDIKISKTCQMNGNSYTGGIAGDLDGNANNCVNHATVKGYNYVGGLVGFFGGTGTIQDCANYGDVKAASYVGGLAGYVKKGKMQNVFCYGSIRATTSTQYIGMAYGYSENGTTEGMVAYYSGAKLTVNNGQEITVKAFGSGNLSEEKATAFTEAQLKSGEVAWRLNGSTSVPAEGSTLAWYQKLGENGDAYPLLKSTGDNIVYHGLACNKATDVYTNNKSIFDISGIIPHKYEKNYDANGLYGDICTVCGEGSSTMYIKNFCGEEGKDLKLEVGSDGKYSTNDMELADGKAYNSPVDFLVRGSLTYTRNFKSNKWQTLYVPFCFDTSKLPEEYEVATINNFHEYELENETKKVELEVKRVTDGSTIPALTPCIIRLKQMPTEDKQLNIKFNDIKAVAAANKSIDCWSISRYYKFNGTIEAKTTFDIESDFVMKDGELWKVSSRTKLNPQRWYLTAKDRSASQLAASAKLSRIAIKVVGNGQATGIEDIHVVSDEYAQSKQGIYDLQGRKLNQEPTHGIYIKNGKKYVK